jgi:hypothetical protein
MKYIVVVYNHPKQWSEFVKAHTNLQVYYEPISDRLIDSVIPVTYIPIKNCLWANAEKLRGYRLIGCANISGCDIESDLMRYIAERMIKQEEIVQNKHSKVEWSLAPEDATFYANGTFRKLDDSKNVLMWFNHTWNPAPYSQEDLKSHNDYEERPATIVKPVTTGSGAIKSDGGSSSYYDIQLSDKIIDFIVANRYIKTEQLIEALGSDFDIGNIVKCSVRINSLMQGKGKEGNDVAYDANKIIYSAGRLKEREQDK